MPTLDLFLSKEALLAEFCKHKEFFSKADVMRWGLDNYYLRADRTIRDFVQEGRVQVVSDDERNFRNLKGKMRWYKYVGKNLLTRNDLRSIIR